MTEKVFFGSARQAHPDAKEILPVKLDLIMERLNLREHTEGEKVALRMHPGNNIGYSTNYRRFFRRVVQAVKDGGRSPSPLRTLLSVWALPLCGEEWSEE